VSEKKPEIKKRRPPQWLDSYIDPLSMKEVAISDYGLEKLASEIVKWANTKDAFTITQFFLPKGIPPKAWYRWLDKSEVLRDAQDVAKELIAIRREMGVANGKLRSDMIKPVHGYYSKVWKDEHDRISKINDITGNDKVVIIEVSPSSDVVPVLKQVLKKD
jgi:hypothetical protein